MKVVIVSYNPEWKSTFEKEYNLLMASLKEKNIEIEHIGSTSIEGLGAKPIIDILIGIKDFKTADMHVATFENLGYDYISKHEVFMPYRRFFTKKLNGHSTHNVHLVELGTEFWNRHLKFRNHLRNNVEDRDKYFALKMELSKKDWKDGGEYANAKTDFIRSIEAK